MVLKKIDYDFTICKVKDFSEVDLNQKFCFVGKTDEELSVVCITEKAPKAAIQRDSGWKCFRVEGTLDFSLIGILSKISAVLAENKIGIFAVSTYNTDYILVKKESFDKAVNALQGVGYEFE